MSRQPIAAVIPCFNLGRTLDEALESLLGQTRPPHEIVLVDDGSTDIQTLQVLARLRRDGHKVIRTPNRGVSAARNCGIGATSAPLIALLDADDVLEPVYLEKASARLEADESLAFVSCAMRGFGASDYQWRPPEPELLQAVVGGVVHMSTLFRREVWEAVGGFDEEIEAYEELDFWTTVMEKGFRGEVLPEALLRYRVRSDSMYHGAIRPGRHEELMAGFYAKHATLVDRHWKALLAAKESFLVEQRDHQRYLAHRLEKVEAELGGVNRHIFAAEERLRHRGEVVPDLGNFRRTTPISRLWGQDRGRPLDRFYIETFLDSHRRDIRGAVLEIKDPGYSQLFGDDRVTSVDILDIDRYNPHATITGDLCEPGDVPVGRYDCFILTQTLNVLYDVRAALAHAVRALRPGGVLLCTVSALNRISYEDGGLDGDFWRFTEASLRRLCAEVVRPEDFEVTVFGNVLACTALLHGLAIHELTPEELNEVDPFFPLIYGVRIVKPRVDDRPTAGQPRAAILMYHRVADDPLDPFGLCVPPQIFADQIDLLARAHNVISLPNMVEALTEGRLQDQSIAITFDDGYLDNLENAAPLLESRGLPATFFVTGEGLDSETEYWWDTLARIFLGSGPLPTRLILEVGGVELDLPTVGELERHEAHDSLWDGLFPLGPADRRRTVDALLEKSGAVRGPVGFRRPMLRDEVRRLAAVKGMTIGAHSTHHLRLDAQPDNTRAEEVVGNKRVLEEVLGTKVELFAYPFGAVDENLLVQVRTAGFGAAVTVEKGLVPPGCDPWHLPRLDVKAWASEVFERRLDELFIEG